MSALRNSTIYLSGLSSDPNPSPGLGTARSIRLAFPAARIVGVDYSNRVSGLHWKDFADIWLQRPWDELDLVEYGDAVRDVLDSGAMWISGLDVEGLWLASVLGGHPNLLVPSAQAFARVAKPPHEAASYLPVRSPASLALTTGEQDLHAFCRQRGWPVWVKGPYYEARPICDWREFLSTRAELSSTWSGIDGMYLEGNVDGNEEAIALCALRGELLGTAHMRKRTLTSEGKTWTGRVERIDTELLDAVRNYMRELRWTGGAEIELVRDEDGQLWLLEMNPRFPAWIHGATLCGVNLPAMLLAAAEGSSAPRARPQAEEFTRVVLEIPVRKTFPSPPPTSAGGTRARSPQKHPSGMPLLARRLRNGHSRWRQTLPESPVVMPRLGSIDGVGSPAAVFLEEAAVAQFALAAELALRLSAPGIHVRIAYSIKTNPDTRLVRLAERNGLLAEVISQHEARKAIAEGFARERIILNGPGKWWPGTGSRVWGGYVFCDSSVELESLDLTDCSSGPLVVGPRIRPPGFRSRFGVDVSSRNGFEQLASSLRRMPPGVRLGVHFHMPSSAVGLSGWWRAFGATLSWAGALQTATGRDIECLDIGGGWFPEDVEGALSGRLSAALTSANHDFTALTDVLIELGKSLAQPCFALLVRVMEVRRCDGAIQEITVDGSISELPDLGSFPHRIMSLDRQTGQWASLGYGDGRILGRLCMEDDVLAANVLLPAQLAAGDPLVFCDVGAYDFSMAYAFGRG